MRYRARTLKAITATQGRVREIREGVSEKRWVDESPAMRKSSFPPFARRFGVSAKLLLEACSLQGLESFSRCGSDLPRARFAKPRRVRPTRGKDASDLEVRLQQASEQRRASHKDCVTAW